jgi:hypothetical protein
MSTGIEAWEHQALQETDPDSDVPGVGKSHLTAGHTSRSSGSNDDQSESIASWETKALQATDPDIDAMSVHHSVRSAGNMAELSRTVGTDDNIKNIKSSGSDLDPSSNSAPQVQEHFQVSSEPSASKSYAASDGQTAEKSNTKSTLNLPDQIQKVRKFLLSLQQQVHRDAKVSARSLADLYRIDRSRKTQSKTHILASIVSSSPTLDGKCTRCPLNQSRRSP